MRIKPRKNFVCCEPLKFELLTNDWQASVLRSDRDQASLV